jgi:CRISPR-associated endonuclease Cas3-HD
MAYTDIQSGSYPAHLNNAGKHQRPHALYAHSRADTPQELWHSLEAHLRDTAEKARQFAQPWGAGDWVWNAAWLHDLGKADSRFQGYLLRENGLDDTEYDQGRVNHSSAGAACAEDRLQRPGRVLAYLIAGHHAGLPDWHPEQVRKNSESLHFIRFKTCKFGCAGSVQEKCAIFGVNDSSFFAHTTARGRKFPLVTTE